MRLSWAKALNQLRQNAVFIRLSCEFVLDLLFKLALSQEMCTSCFSCTAAWQAISQCSKISQPMEGSTYYGCPRCPNIGEHRAALVQKISANCAHAIAKNLVSAGDFCMYSPQLLVHPGIFGLGDEIQRESQRLKCAERLPELMGKIS